MGPPSSAPTVLESSGEPTSKLELKAVSRHRGSQGRVFATGKRGGTPGSFGQPRFPKALNQRLRVCLPAPSDHRGYCKGGIDLKYMRRHLTRFGVTSEMGESGRETAVSGHPEGALTKGLPPNDDGFVKATKFDTTSEQSA